LIVPVAAIYARSDGEEYVTVLSPRGSERDVAIKVGLDSNGYVAVAPQQDGTLSATDKVFIGSNGAR